MSPNKSDKPYADMKKTELLVVAKRLGLARLIGLNKAGILKQIERATLGRNKAKVKVSQAKT
ncbi:MAG: hypothetical protein V1754_03170, partial [Pseudomonadota bacterium]